SHDFSYVAKSSILLDADMVAHVGDFGLARLLGADLNQSISSGVKGTIGYAPPEYGTGSEMTSIGDVYSFGILLLEVMTGKKPTDGMFNEVDVIDGELVMKICCKVRKRMQRKWKNVSLQLSRLEYHALWIPHRNE
ncbi:kinase-like domain-containing protein, partial [Tanacetum coccineum]